MDIESLISIFEKELSNDITPSRFDHCLRVAALAERFAIVHGYSYPRKAYLAGIVHDITKQKKREFHLEIFRKKGFDFSEIPENAFHAFSGALYLEEKFEMKDSELLSAVRNHTLGGKNLNLLDSILYTSDFLGSDYALKQQDYHSWVEKTEESLYFGIQLKARTVISELISKKESIHLFTVFTYNDAIVQLKERNK